MRSLKRITAAMAGILLLQLSLLGSGTLCTLRGGHPVGESMSGHAMAASATTNTAAIMAWTSSQEAADVGLTNGTDYHGPDDSCCAPWANRACGAMSSCTLAVSAPSAIATSAATLSSAADLPALIQTLSDLKIAPEAPPPRA